jgi:hypothetical protein
MDIPEIEKPDFLARLMKNADRDYEDYMVVESTQLGAEEVTKVLDQISETLTRLKHDLIRMLGGEEWEAIVQRHEELRSGLAEAQVTGRVPERLNLLFSQGNAENIMNWYLKLRVGLRELEKAKQGYRDRMAEVKGFFGEYPGVTMTFGKGFSGARGYGRGDPDEDSEKGPGDDSGDDDEDQGGHPKRRKEESQGYPNYRESQRTSSKKETTKSPAQQGYETRVGGNPGYGLNEGVYEKGETLKSGAGDQEEGKDSTHYRRASGDWRKKERGMLLKTGPD